MRIENHRCTKYVSENSSTRYRSNITLEVGEETHIDREIDHEEYYEILDDTIVSHFFE